MKPSPHGGRTGLQAIMRGYFPSLFLSPRYVKMRHFISSAPINCAPAAPPPPPFPPCLQPPSNSQGFVSQRTLPFGRDKKTAFPTSLFKFPFADCHVLFVRLCPHPPKKSRISVVSSGGESSVGLEFFFPPLDQASKSGQTRFPPPPPPPPPLLTRLTHKSTAGKGKVQTRVFPQLEKKVRHVFEYFGRFRRKSRNSSLLSLCVGKPQVAIFFYNGGGLAFSPILRPL